MCALLAAPTSHYVDDYSQVDFASSKCSVQHALARISKIVGFPVEPSKRQTMAASNVALGVAMDLTKVHEESSPIRFFPAPGRVDGILKIIESALDESSLAPGIADSLVGKLGFLATSSYGRCGRAANAPLRQVANGSTTSWVAIRDALEFFQRIVPNIPHRTQRFAPPPALYAVYSDASLQFMCVVAVNRMTGAITVARTAITDDVAHRFALDRANIAHWEALAALSGLATFAQELSGRSTVLFIDNTHVASNLISGYSDQRQLVQMMHTFWETAATYSIAPWIEYVASKSNLADPPSRLPFPTCFSNWPKEDLNELLSRSTQRDFVFPTHLPLHHPLGAAPRH